jgi:hypothetical protein
MDDDCDDDDRDAFADDKPLRDSEDVGPVSSTTR